MEMLCERGMPKHLLVPEISPLCSPLLLEHMAKLTRV